MCRVPFWGPQAYEYIFNDSPVILMPRTEEGKRPSLLAVILPSGFLFTHHIFRQYVQIKHGASTPVANSF